MTHDELIQFAAEKLGIKVIQRRVFWEVIGDEDIYEKHWFILEDDGFNEIPFDLTSPDLFLKGVGVCPYQTHLLYDNVSRLGRYVAITDMSGERYIRKHFDDEKEAPLTFWQCWYELEKG